MMLAMLAAAAIAAAPECPKPQPGQPPLVTADPDWLVKPEPEDIYWAYPTRALAERVTGHAIIRCELTEQGVADPCEVQEETPARYGFGAAALKLAAKMLFKPRIQCGVVVRGEVRIPIAFSLPKENPALATTPLDPADRKLALAARLVEAMGYDEALEANSENGALWLLDEAEEDHEVSMDERRHTLEAAHETWLHTKGQVLNGIARSLASRMDEQELTAAIAFYEGPVGAKIVAQGDALQEDMDAIFEALQPEMMLGLRRRLCERMPTLCTPEDAI